MMAHKTPWALLSALLLIISCRQTEQEVPETLRKTVRFTAGTADTRTAFSDPEDGVYQTLWTGNEQAVLLSLNYGMARPAAVSASEDGKTAAFEADIDASGLKSPYTFYAVSPASAARAISPSRKAWSVSIAASQKPLSGSVDEAAQLLVAESPASSVLPDEVPLHFSHLTAYGRLTLKNLSLGEASVSKVELTCGTPFVGEWYWHEDGSIEANGASSTLTLETDASGDLWFACAPVDVSGVRFRVSVFTTAGVLTKEITFPQGRKFTSGRVARFSVDMAGVEPQGAGSDGFSLLTDASALKAGDEVVFLNAGGTAAMGAQSGNFRLAETTGFTLDGTTVTLSEDSSVRILTVENGSTAGTWSFRDAEGYLAASTSASKNYLRSVSGKDGYGSWTLSISDGNASLAAQQGTRNLLRYNPSAPRFSCYGSGQQLVRIYVKGSGSGASMEDDLLAKETELGCYMTGFERLYGKGSDQFCRFDEDGKRVFALLNPSSKEQLVVSGYDPTLVKGDRVTVSVRYRKGKQTLLNRTYTLTVVREDGPKVWLGNGSGEGFIIMK